ncbi:hypothetical protein BJX99DRAFT_265420 [Aspergillus californicus]
MEFDKSRADNIGPIAITGSIEGSISGTVSGILVGIITYIDGKNGTSKFVIDGHVWGTVDATFHDRPNHPFKGYIEASLQGDIQDSALDVIDGVMKGSVRYSLEDRTLTKVDNLEVKCKITFYIPVVFEPEDPEGPSYRDDELPMIGDYDHGFLVNPDGSIREAMGEIEQVIYCDYMLSVIPKNEEAISDRYKVVPEDDEVGDKFMFMTRQKLVDLNDLLLREDRARLGESAYGIWWSPEGKLLFGKGLVTQIFNAGIDFALIEPDMKTIKEPEQNPWTAVKRSILDGLMPKLTIS